MLKWLCDEPGKIIRIKSWLPTRGRHGIEWPLMLVERQGRRMTCTPVWDRIRLSELFRRSFLRND